MAKKAQCRKNGGHHWIYVFRRGVYDGGRGQTIPLRYETGIHINIFNDQDRHSPNVQTHLLLDGQQELQVRGDIMLLAIFALPMSSSRSPLRTHIS
jgi:hypothetical protein